MNWDQLRSPVLGNMPRTTPVILPMAATEQHGDHLPLATDRMIVDHFCKLINAHLGESVLILPTVSVGCSDHHLDFAGSLSVQHHTFENQCCDILRSAHHHGFTRFLLLNSHGGNAGIGRVIMEKMGYELQDAHIAFLSWFTFASAELLPLQESARGGVGHAGEFETSLMLTIAPELVDITAIENIGTHKRPAWADGDLLKGAPAAYYRTFAQFTKNGVFGDPRTASAVKGDQITEVVVSKILSVLKELPLL
ncbi:MAG: creatininase family protein [Saprospiraceae bacterium]|nr:creatininase family protein [Saprospiraceae bacterium]